MHVFGRYTDGRVARYHSHALKCILPIPLAMLISPVEAMEYNSTPSSLTAQLCTRRDELAHGMRTTKLQWIEAVRTLLLRA